MASHLLRNKQFLRSVLSYSYLWSLPLYFILDAVNKFWGFIPGYNCLIVFVIVLGSATVMLFLFKRLLGVSFASLAIIWLLVQYLFFKIIKEHIVSFTSVSLYQYKFYLPFILFISLLYFLFIKRLGHQKQTRLNIYINTVLVIFSFVEVGKLSYNLSFGSVPAVTTDTLRFKPLQTGVHPNVYLLLMDEYQGSYISSNYFDFKNDQFIYGLKRRNFFVAEKPASNYNLTPFSVLSLLNMGYINGFTDKDISSGLAFNMCAAAVKKNQVTGFFEAAGYNIVNNSFFSIENAGRVRRLFLPTEERLMLDKTFGNVFINDLAASFQSNSFHKLIKDGPVKTDLYNETVIFNTKNAASKYKTPFFIYSHFMMPHFPYLRDSTGMLRNIRTAHLESNKGRNIESYVSYMKYTNKILIEIIDDILQRDSGAIIVLTSDHGLREAPKGDTFFNEFNNFFALHTPGKKYKGFTDTTSLVNVFRLLLNNHFNQNIPVLKDTMINVNLSLRKRMQ